MANTDIKTSQLVLASNLDSTDRFVVVRNASNSSLATTNTVSFSTIRSYIAIANTPANSSALTVRGGTLLYDSNYLYIAVANNVVKRVSLQSF